MKTFCNNCRTYQSARCDQCAICGAGIEFSKRRRRFINMDIVAEESLEDDDICDDLFDANAKLYENYEGE